MRHFMTAFVTILLVSHNTHAQSHPSAKRCAEQNKEIASLIEEYRELRERRRELQPGVFDADLDGFKGKLHEVLSQLGEELGHAPYTKAQVIRCLGQPDAVKNEKEMNGLLGIYQREKKIAGQQVKQYRNPQYLIYFWRGGHDFLFFISEDGRVVDHGWWFAYE